VKTYSQVLRERAEHVKTLQEEKRQRQERAVRTLDDIETRDADRQVAFELTASDLHTRSDIRRGIREGTAVAADVACDRCGCELFMPTPDIIFVSGGRAVSCPGCGFYASL
jgi:formylmethanofuran dehydrogenase subunit E